MKNKLKKNFKFITIIIILLSLVIAYSNIIISWSGESELVITPKPNTNNMHLKWTGPLNSTYRIFQKKPGSNNFESIGLTDFSPEAINEEVKVLNIYPTADNYNTQLSASGMVIPNVQVTYLDGNTETIPKSALLKAWIEGRNSK